MPELVNPSEEVGALVLTLAATAIGAKRASGVVDTILQWDPASGDVTIWPPVGTNGGGGTRQIVLHSDVSALGIVTANGDKAFHADGGGVSWTWGISPAAANQWALALSGVGTPLKVLTSQAVVIGDAGLPGGLLVQSWGAGTFRNDTGIEVTRATSPGYSCYSSAVGALDQECFIVFGSKDAAGTIQKNMSISSKWADATHGTGYSVLRLNATYLVGETFTDDVALRIFGNHGAVMFGASDAALDAPGAKILHVLGRVAINGAALHAVQVAIFQVNGTGGAFFVRDDGIEAYFTGTPTGFFGTLDAGSTLYLMSAGGITATLNAAHGMAIVGQFACNGHAVAAPQVSGGTTAGVIAGLVAIGLFAS